jgi:hypothetical protein
MCRRKRISRSLRAPESRGVGAVHAVPLRQDREIARRREEWSGEIGRRFAPELRTPVQKAVDLPVVLFGFE